METIRRVLIQSPLPQAGEFLELRKVGNKDTDYERVMYRFNYSYLQKNNLLYEVPQTNLKVLSPSDGMCLWKCLASLAYVEPNWSLACETSYAAALARTAEDTLKVGHLVDVINLVASRLGINVMSLDEFSSMFKMTRIEHLNLKKNAKTNLKLFPALVLSDGHVMLASANSSTKLFSYR